MPSSRSVPKSQFTDTYHSCSQRVSFSKLDDFFRLEIGPRYGHLVEEISAGKRNRLPRVAVALEALPVLTSVKQIVAPSVTMLAELLASEGPVPGAGRDPDRVADYVRASFGAFICGIPSVEVPAEAYSDVLQLCCGSVITKLQISFDPDGRLEPFIAAMDRLEQLVDLRVGLSSWNCRLSRELETSPESGRPSFPVPATLRVLTVSTHSPAPSVFQFIADLAPTVEHLSVIFRPLPSNSRPPAGTIRAKFPSVKILTVEGHTRATTHFVASASSAIFPRLQELVWRGSSGQPCVQNEETALRAFLAGQSASTFPLNAWLEDRLHRVHPFELVDPTSGRRLRVRCRPSQLRRRYPPYPPISYTNPQASYYLGADALHDDVSSSIAYAQRMADQALAVGDHFQLDRLIQVFRELELLRMEQRS